MALKLDTAKLLTLWRGEIAGELDEAKEAVPPLQIELQAASAAHDAASASARELRRILDGFRVFAPPISMRLSFVQGAADDARRARDKSRAALASANAHVAELQTALRQLDTLLAADDLEVAA